MVAVVEKQGQSPHQPPGEPADQGTDGDRPHDVPAKPAQDTELPAGPQAKEPGTTARMQPHEPEPEHHEGKGKPVVQARLAGKGLTGTVLVGGVLDLHVGSEHRVCRGEHRPQKDRRP